VDSIPAGSTQSWFVVKVAVALCPILIFWAAGVIGWFLRRTLWRRSEEAPRSGGLERNELAEARRSSHRPLPRSSSVIQAVGWRQSATRQQSPAQYGPGGATRRSRHGQSVHLGTMVNHRLLRIAQPPVCAVHGWRYWQVPVFASGDAPSGERISRSQCKRAVSHEPRTITT
jgi:hypothetical protein